MKNQESYWLYILCDPTTSKSLWSICFIVQHKRQKMGTIHKAYNILPAGITNNQYWVLSSNICLFFIKVSKRVIIGDVKHVIQVLLLQNNYDCNYSTFCRYLYFLFEYANLEQQNGYFDNGKAPRSTLIPKYSHDCRFIESFSVFTLTVFQSPSSKK